MWAQNIGQTVFASDDLQFRLQKHAQYEYPSLKSVSDRFHLRFFIIGIKHAFPYINVCQVPREMLKTEAVGRGFQHLPRDLANVNVLENHV